jgi:ABC-type ATPase involved in cell division
VYENVAFAMEVCNYRDKDIIKVVPEVLEQV